MIFKKIKELFIKDKKVIPVVEPIVEEVVEPTPVVEEPKGDRPLSFM